MGKTPKVRGRQSTRPYYSRRLLQGQRNSVGQIFLPENYGYPSSQYVSRRISPYRYQYRGARLFGVNQAFRNQTQPPARRGRPRGIPNRKRNMHPQANSEQLPPVEKLPTKEMESHDQDNVIEGKEMESNVGNENDGEKAVNGDRKIVSGESVNDELKSPVKVKATPKEKKSPKSTTKNKASLKHKEDNKKLVNDESERENDGHTEIPNSADAHDIKNKEPESNDIESKEAKNDITVGSSASIDVDKVLGKKTLCLILPQLTIESDNVEATTSESEMDDSLKLSLIDSSVESFKSIPTPSKEFPRRSSRHAIEKQEADESCDVAKMNSERSTRASHSLVEEEDINAGEISQSSPKRNESLGNNIRSISSRRPLRSPYVDSPYPSVLKSRFNTSSAAANLATNGQDYNYHGSTISSTRANFYDFRQAIKNSESHDVTNILDVVDPLSDVHGKRKGDVIDDCQDFKKVKSQQTPVSDTSTQNSGFLSLVSSPLGIFTRKARNDTFISCSTPLEAFEPVTTGDFQEGETQEKAALIVDDVSEIKIQEKECPSPYSNDIIDQETLKHKNWCTVM